MPSRISEACFVSGPVEAMGTGSTVEYFVVELLSFGLESTYHMLYFHYVHVIIASIGMDEQGDLVVFPRARPVSGVCIPPYPPGESSRYGLRRRRFSDNHRWNIPCA